MRDALETRSWERFERILWCQSGCEWHVAKDLEYGFQQGLLIDVIWGLAFALLRHCDLRRSPHTVCLSGHIDAIGEVLVFW